MLEYLLVSDVNSPYRHYNKINSLYSGCARDNQFQATGIPNSISLFFRKHLGIALPFLPRPVPLCDQMYAVEDDGKFIGFFGFGRLSFPKDMTNSSETFTEIQFCAVVPELRNQGYGRQILNEMLRRSKSHVSTDGSFVAFVPPDSKAFRKLLVSQGFEMHRDTSYHNIMVRHKNTNLLTVPEPRPADH